MSTSGSLSCVSDLLIDVYFAGLLGGDAPGSRRASQLACSHISFEFPRFQLSGSGLTSTRSLEIKSVCGCVGDMEYFERPVRFKL